MTADSQEHMTGKDLRWMMSFCFIMGLMPFLFCLWLYCYWGDMQLQADDEFVPAYIDEHFLAIIRILAFGILPVMGFGFIYIGYKFWKWNRSPPPLSRSASAVHLPAVPVTKSRAHCQTVRPSP